VRDCLTGVPGRILGFHAAMLAQRRASP
jgi:hypothetical protein